MGYGNVIHWVPRGEIINKTCWEHESFIMGSKYAL